MDAFKKAGKDIAFQKALKETWFNNDDNKYKKAQEAFQAVLSEKNDRSLTNFLNSVSFNFQKYALNKNKPIVFNWTEFREIDKKLNTRISKIHDSEKRNKFRDSFNGLIKLYNERQSLVENYSLQ